MPNNGFSFLFVLFGHSSPCPLLQSPAKLKRKRELGSDEKKEKTAGKSSKKTKAAPVDPGKPHKREAEMPDPARVQGLMEIGTIRLAVKVSHPAGAAR